MMDTSGTPRSIRVFLFLAVAWFVAVSVTACVTRSREAPAPTAANSTANSEGRSQANDQSSIVRESDNTYRSPVFEAEGIALYWVGINASCNRSTSQRSGPRACRITVNLQVLDKTSRQLYSLDPRIEMTEIRDDKGGDLLDSWAPDTAAGNSNERTWVPFKPRDTSGRSTAPGVQPQQSVPIALNLESLPPRLSSFAGRVRVIVAAQIESREYELAPMSEPVEVVPGVRLRVREVLTSASGNVVATVEHEITQPASTFDLTKPPFILVLELVDAAGRGMGPLELREEIIAGGTLRSRYVSKELGGRGSTPTKLRVELITQARPIDLAFRFVDIPLAEP